jgi:hypothetical protein
MCFNYRMGFEPEPPNNLGNDASQREIESFRGPQGLKAMPFVECYRRDEHDLHNVYESTRLGWRKQLAHEWHKKSDAEKDLAALEKLNPKLAGELAEFLKPGNEEDEYAPTSPRQKS